VAEITGTDFPDDVTAIFAMIGAVAALASVAGDGCRNADGTICPGKFEESAQ
jgi:hypothetical protein